ncbi:MAG: hypothetical protein NT003_04480 [Candidatus Magasanikbacteria bacterium]|nr:hypothetical protein [Candidatus Magasanikbacteria bacterium]
MKFVLSKNKINLGTLSFDDVMYHFIGNNDTQIFLANAVRAGIEIFYEDFFDGTYTMKSETIDSSDPRFSLGLVDFLRRNNFSVQEIRPEIESEFHEIISQLPSDSPLRQSAESQWKSFSYLEKTQLLDLIQRDTLFS